MNLLSTSLPITSLYAGLLGLLLVVLSVRVVLARTKHEVSVGDGGHDEILIAQRMQGNFIEYVPIALLLIALLEMDGTSAAIVQALGISLVAARLMHPFGLAPEFRIRLPRALGSVITWAVIAVASLMLVWGSVV
jgi:uncharacterized membrane protein YecN with MAPEG domain